MSEDTKKIIYSMVGVSKHYNKQPIIKDISLSYFYGAKIGVLGLNGSGKSTLLRIMAGIDKEFNGQTILSEGFTIGFLEQEPLVDCTKTVREVVEEGVQETVDLLREFEEINAAFADPDADMEQLCERQAVVQDKLDALDAWELDSRLDLAMDALRCPPGDTQVKVLSGGEKRRVALCRLLLQKPDILLLDEPTNHLDAETVGWLEQHLQRYEGTVIAVTHDRYFLDNVAGWILELDRGHGIPWKGNYSSWLEQKQERLRREEKAESQRQKTLQHELEWVRMSPKARHAKGQARISAYEKLLNQEASQRERELELYIPAGPRLGGVVIEAQEVAKGFGERLLFEHLNFSLPPGDTPVAVLSGGEKRRVALCRLLLQKPDILLLDEPTNHLDAETVGWLEQHLQRYEGTVIAVTHDRYFLDNVAGWILELDRGHGIPWKGNYSSWLEQKQERLRREEKAESQRQKTLQRELEWVRMAPKARHAKGQARISAYEKLLNQDAVQRDRELELFIPPGPRLGGVVIEAQGVAKGYGERLLFENLNFSLPPGGIVGIIGPNGAGKTTLFRMISGTEQPDAGSFKIGETVKLAYADQERGLDPEKTLWEEVTGGQEQIPLGRQLVNSRGYVARFNFSGSDQQKKVGVLSGGERNRVHLAKMLREEANVLLLDEPTNDLDVNTLRALEEALENFAGCAVVISHDRWFLDRIATHILAFEGDSQVVWFEGNYSEYEEDRKKRLGAAADRPHRIKYRQLTRQ